MSAVNAAEVVTKLAERGMNADLAMRTLSGLAIEVVAFDIEQAALTGALRPSTRTAGLSLGDRACLALGKLRRLPVMTAERAWTPLAEAIGVEIIQIREVS
jgi:PIN domain nuclease of toxin-antitoxin system